MAHGGINAMTNDSEPKMNIEELVNELFEVFDDNRDGVISRHEFVGLIKSLLHESEIELSGDIFKKFDANHDNAISREELIDMVIELAI